MGVRESINKNQTIAAIVAGVVIMLLVGVIVWQVWFANTAPAGGGGAGQRFFTVDDGKSYFADDAKKYPPFDKDGKPAVQAMVFKDMDSGNVFVGYLMRYTPAGKKMLEDADKQQGAQRRLAPETVIENEIKKPLTGDAGWVKSTDPRAAEVLNLTSPTGGTNLEPVMP